MLLLSGNNKPQETLYHTKPLFSKQKENTALHRTNECRHKYTYIYICKGNIYTLTKKVTVQMGTNFAGEWEARANKEGSGGIYAHTYIHVRFWGQHPAYCSVIFPICCPKELPRQNSGNHTESCRGLSPGLSCA